MKKLLLLLLPLWSMAQTFPYDEGFQGTISGTLPVGWTGDMKVQADHGIGENKGMAADISSVDNIDSAITPWIGPLDANTEFYFWYRMVDQFIYPSTQKNILGDGKLVISYSTDSINYTPFYTIDSGNHIASLAFKRIVLPLTSLGGQTVKFKFWCNFDGGSSYFVDIDSIKVRPSTGLAVNDLSTQTLKVYPNPVKVGNHVLVEFAGGETPQHVFVYDALGKQLALLPTTKAQSTVIGHLSTENFAPGIYFIQYGNRAKKLVVE